MQKIKKPEFSASLEPVRITGISKTERYEQRRIGWIECTGKTITERKGCDCKL